MVFKTPKVPPVEDVRELTDIPPDTLAALRIMEAGLYGGVLRTLARAAELLVQLDRSYYTLIAVSPENHHEVKGVAVVDRSTDNLAWLRGLVIDSDARREGIGSGLLEHVEQNLKDQGFNRVGLFDVGGKAVEFYESQGYRTVGGDHGGVVELQKDL